METDYIDLTEGVMRGQEMEFECKLIKLIKDQECLYDKDHFLYPNKQQRDLAWLKVSAELGKSTIECINKWYYLVQTFFYLHSLESKGYRRLEAVKWPHYEALKQLRSQMVEKYMDLVLTIQADSLGNGSISKAQKEALITEVESNSEVLMNAFISNALRQEIWTNMANKLNDMTSGIPLPTIQWQRACHDIEQFLNTVQKCNFSLQIWWDIKQKIVFRKKLELKGIHVNRLGGVANEDIRVLKICGLTAADINKSIAGLESHIEIDANTDQEICKNCADLKTASRLCVNCSPLRALICDVCVSAASSTKCDITCWSSAAKRMIPIQLRHNRIIAICQACHTSLKRKASLLWKTCRFCAQEKQYLKNFLSPSLQLVREAFCSATNITICMSDGLPCFVCTKCLNQLHHFQQFYMEFCNAQIILQKIHETRFMDNDLIREFHKKSPAKMSNESFRSCQDIPITVPENSEERTLKQVLISRSEVSAMCGREGQKESNSATIKCKAVNNQEKLLQNIKTIQNQIAESMRNPTSVPASQSLLRATFSTYRESANTSLNSPSNTEFAAVDSRNTKASHKDKDDIFSKSTGKVILLSENSNIDAIPRVCGEISISMLPRRAIASTSAELAPNALESSKLVDRTPVVVSCPSSSSQLLISNVFSLNQSNSQSKDVPIGAQDSCSDHRSKNASFVSADASIAFIPHIKTTASKPLSSTNKPFHATESQVQKTRPPIPTTMQKAFEAVDSASPLKKSTLNPLLQSLLDKPALDPSSSFNPIRIHNCKPPPEKQVASTTVNEIEIRSSKLVPSKCEINSFTPLTSNSFNEDSTFKIAPKKSLERRSTMYELCLPKSSTSARKTSLEEEIIVIRDDTPPRDVELPTADNSIDPCKLCPEQNDELKPLVEDVVNVEEEEEQDPNVSEKNIKYLSSSALIDYAIDKAYSKNSTTPPQWRNEAAVDDFQSEKNKTSPKKADDKSTLENSQEKEIERKPALRKRSKQNDEERPNPYSYKRMSLRSNKTKSKDVVIK